MILKPRMLPMSVAPQRPAADNQMSDIFYFSFGNIILVGTKSEFTFYDNHQIFNVNIV